MSVFEARIELDRWYRRERFELLRPLKSEYYQKLAKIQERCEHPEWCQTDGDRYHCLHCLVERMDDE